MKIKTVTGPTIQAALAEARPLQRELRRLAGGRQEEQEAYAGEDR